jgi:hypothetical protein
MRLFKIVYLASHCAAQREPCTPHADDARLRGPHLSAAVGIRAACNRRCWGAGAVAQSGRLTGDGVDGDAPHSTTPAAESLNKDATPAFQMGCEGEPHAATPRSTRHAPIRRAVTPPPCPRCSTQHVASDRRLWWRRRRWWGGGDAAWILNSVTGRGLDLAPGSARPLGLIGRIGLIAALANDGPDAPRRTSRCSARPSAGAGVRGSWSQVSCCS